MMLSPPAGSWLSGPVPLCPSALPQAALEKSGAPVLSVQ